MKHIEKIIIDEKRCKHCSICVHICPKDVLAEDSTGTVFVENLSACIGCFSCQDHCPDLAIEVISL